MSSFKCLGHSYLTFDLLRCFIEGKYLLKLNFSATHAYCTLSCRKTHIEDELYNKDGDKNGGVSF